MSKKSIEEQSSFALPMSNYKFIVAGVVLLILGFILMSGGAADSPDEFHYDEIFAFRRITLAPLVCLLGYTTVMVGIFKKPKE